MGIDCGPYRATDGLQRLPPVLGEYPVQRFLPELPAILIEGLIYAIGKDGQQVAGFQLQPIERERLVLCKAQRRPGLLLQSVHVATPAQRGGSMAAAGIGQFQAIQRQPADEQGDEHIILVIFHQFVVELGHDFSGIKAGVDELLQQGHGARHEQRRRHTLVGHVTHRQKQVRFALHAKAVKVATH